MRIVALLLCGCLAPTVSAQQTTGRGLVRAIGEASVSVRPDAARVTVSVVKQGRNGCGRGFSKRDATAEVIAALRQLLGANAEIRTVAFTLAPVYVYPRDSTPPQITGFNVTNTIHAVASDTALAGRVVDAAITAGATRVDGVGLFLRDDDATRAQALRLAAQRARSKAEAIALGLGVRLGSVLTAQEGASAQVLPVGRTDVGAAATTPPTPIEAGTLEVRATVTLDVEITP